MARTAAIAACGALAFGLIGPLDAQQPLPAGSCRINGRAASAGTALPGVSVLVQSGASVKAATSTDTDGTYRLTLPSGPYQVTAELTGFERVAREITLVAGAPCDQTIDFQLALSPRLPKAPFAVPGAPSAAAQRFETLTVQTQAAVAAGVETTDSSDAAARLLLPPGFSTEGPTEALAINGNMASVDRGMMADRFDAIGRGEFDPARGAFGEGFGQGGGGDSVSSDVPSG